MQYPSFIGEPWWWRFGLPSPIWIRNLEVIEKLVSKHQLKALETHQLPQLGGEMQALEMSVEVKRTRGAQPFPPRPFPGGLRIAHVHFEGRVYPLERAQWQEFSGQVIERVKRNLDASGAIGFAQLVELTDAVEGM